MVHGASFIFFYLQAPDLGNSIEFWEVKNVKKFKENSQKRSEKEISSKNSIYL